MNFSPTRPFVSYASIVLLRTNCCRPPQRPPARRTAPRAGSGPAARSCWGRSGGRFERRTTRYASSAVPMRSPSALNACLMELWAVPRTSLVTTEGLSLGIMNTTVDHQYDMSNVERYMTNLSTYHVGGHQLTRCRQYVSIDRFGNFTFCWSGPVTTVARLGRLPTHVHMTETLRTHMCTRLAPSTDHTRGLRMQT